MHSRQSVSSILYLRHHLLFEKLSFSCNDKMPRSEKIWPKKCSVISFRIDVYRIFSSREINFVWREGKKLVSGSCQYLSECQLGFLLCRLIFDGFALSQLGALATFKEDWCLIESKCTLQCLNFIRQKIWPKEFKFMAGWIVGIIPVLAENSGKCQVSIWRHWQSFRDPEMKNWNIFEEDKISTSFSACVILFFFLPRSDFQDLSKVGRARNSAIKCRETRSND